MRPRRATRWVGSLPLAVVLLITIAVVLAWGTIYETRFGTASVQRFIYQSWWFQGLLGFLAVNLAAAALERLPWKRRHLPFLLAHLGIILILIGGVLGGRFGVEGQLIIQEGQAQRTLLLSQNTLVIRKLNPGIAHAIPTRFETQAWVHEPNAAFLVPHKDAALQVTVDRYFPNAEATEEISPDGTRDNPAVQVAIAAGAHQDTFWFLARDAQRFGAQWHDAHLLFLELEAHAQLADLFGSAPQRRLPERGVVTIELPTLGVRQEIPVPEEFSQPIRIEGSPYRVLFKEYFTDFAITAQGMVNRSAEPNNPAIALTITGPEGSEPFLAFALHPDFPLLHGREHTIHAQVTYAHGRHAQVLPPSAICIVRHPQGGLSWVLTGPAGERHVATATPGERLVHPWLGYEVEIVAYYPRARAIRQFTNRDNEVRAEALHVIARDGESQAEAWVAHGVPAQLELGHDTVLVDYRKAQREIPVTIQLLDFRKIDYPGTSMAAGFESDVRLTDPRRGLTLTRKISMNNPLRYWGLTFYQASYIPGSPETTVLAVRSDPGTPFVYLGFVVVVLGIVSLFVLHATSGRSRADAAGWPVRRRARP